MDELTVVVVTYRSARHIDPCLDSVLAGAGNVPVRLLVIDNDSPDDTVKRLDEWGASHPHADLKVVRNDDNVGFARAVNQALELADTDYVLLVNPDVVVDAGAIDDILRFAVARPGHRLYVGRSSRPDGGLDPWTCMGRPTLWSVACWASGLSSIAPRNRWFSPESLGPWQRDTVRSVPVAIGAFLLLDREFVTGIGGFDESFFLYSEDIELSVRARRNGADPVLVPTARLVHEIGGSSEARADKLELVLRGRAHLIRRTWRPAPRRVGLQLMHVGVLLRAAGAILTGRSPAWRTVWSRRGVWHAGWSDGGLTRPSG